MRDQTNSRKGEWTGGVTRGEFQFEQVVVRVQKSVMELWSYAPRHLTRRLEMGAPKRSARCELKGFGSEAYPLA